MRSEVLRSRNINSGFRVGEKGRQNDYTGKHRYSVPCKPDILLIHAAHAVEDKMADGYLSLNCLLPVALDP